MGDKIENKAPSAEIMQNDLLDEVYKALGIPADGKFRRLIALNVMPIIKRITDWTLRLERLTREYGLPAAAREMTPSLIRNLNVKGGDKIPEAGPLVIAANHPTGLETFPITAYSARDDLKIVSSKIEFFEELPCVGDHLIFTTHDTSRRMNVMRESIRHLQGGGALLIYPSGRIDPDPHFFSTAKDHLNRWSQSLAMFIKKVPETRVVTAITSNMLRERFLFSKLTEKQEYRKDRQMMSTFLQGLSLFTLKRPRFNANLTFGDPIAFANEKLDDLNAIQARIVASARDLLDEHLNIFPPKKQETWKEHPA